MDMEQNPKHAAIVRTIIDLARELGMQTVAEGVESSAQLHLLESLGCRSAQGNLFAPALDLKRANALFERESLVLKPGDEPDGLAGANLLRRTRDFFRRV
jgi:EAL domain-containing protein (putative c-di-GMP-specific phosphodiesterase class I)